MKIFMILQFIVMDAFIIYSFINKNKEEYKQNKIETIQINKKFYNSIKFYDCKKKLLDKIYNAHDLLSDRGLAESDLLESDYDSLYFSRDTSAIFYACDNLD